MLFALFEEVCVDWFCFVVVLVVYCFMFLRLFGVSRFDCCFSISLVFLLLWLVYVCLDWFSCCGLLEVVGGWVDLCSVDCGVCVCVVAAVGFVGFDLCCSRCVSLLICFAAVLGVYLCCVTLLCELLRWRWFWVGFGGLCWWCGLDCFTSWVLCGCFGGVGRCC